LPTPSLRQQYHNFKHADSGDGKGSVSLPNLSENTVFFSQDVQVLTLELERTHSVFGASAPRATPLRSQRFGSSIVARDRVTKALPRQQLCDDLRAVQQAHNSLEHLAAVARDFERKGRGPEVTAAQPHRRMRGLDFLYSVRNDSAMLPKPEDEGGVKPKEEDDCSEDTRQKAYKILKNVSYFQTLETSASGLSWRVSKRCEFFKEAAGQVVFRQGDPAGNCYVLVSGQVAVKIFKPSDDEDEDCPSPREAHEHRMYWYETLTESTWGGYQDERSNKEREEKLRKYFVWAEPKRPVKAKEPEPEVKSLRRRSIQSVLAVVVQTAESMDTSKVDEDDPDRDMSLLEQLQQEDRPRYKTLEGHGTWCPKESCLGVTVATLGPGTIFGELALQNDKDRAASIECTEDCEFLLIPRFVYRRILKELTSRSQDSLNAVKILRQLKFFQDMEAERPGICDRLAQKTDWQDCPAGQVIFRQQDPPGNCYILCEGAVDIYKCGPEAVPREGEARKLKRIMTPRTCTMFDLSQMYTLIDAKRAAKGVFSQGARYLTLEKFSSYCKNSVLGPKVATLTAPACFGELALKNTAPRAATVKCKTACRLIVLEKQHVLGVLFEVMAKIRFFNDRLPGIKDIEYRMDHPSQHFHLRTFPPGYQFLYEGIVMTEPAIYVLKSGSVEFRRYRRVSQNPAYVLSNLPMVESSWKSLTARPRTGVAGSTKSIPPPVSRSGKHTPRENLGEEVVCDEMLDEGVFCTLPFFPLFSVEPFTVVATTHIQVFHAGAEKVRKMPADALSGIRKHLLLSLKERIRKLPEEVAEVDTQLFNITGEGFYKNILDDARKHMIKYKPTYEEHLQKLKQEGGLEIGSSPQEANPKELTLDTPKRILRPRT